MSRSIKGQEESDDDDLPMSKKGTRENVLTEKKSNEKTPKIRRKMS
jgi:hypothetical protein